MDRGVEYAQSEQSSAATYSTQDPRSATLSSNTTPISEYSHGPSSARAPSYSQDHPARYPQYSQPPNQHGSLVTMAQQPNPSISQASPTYPPYSPYAAGPGPDGMQQYAQHQAPQYDYNRGGPGPQPGPWSGYPPHQPMPGQYHHPGAVGQPPQTSAPQRSGQVYSFVPIPGAQQHKRPRRRYEEIERMYKCGWNGCEKAYGTLNHLNAHVTMQSHGTKRTPEEFKEIRKEWKARKKEEENARKAEEDRVRVAQQAAQAQQGVDGPPGEHPGQGQSYQQNGGRPLPPPHTTTLPPIGYGPGSEQNQGQYAQPSNMVYQPQSNGSMHYPPQGYPNSPYGQQGQVYQQQGQQSHY